MLNKLKFNNLIISNKKKIKQAHVQTVNKLVHKLRKQQQLLSKQPENVKTKERQRKTNECIEQLKKLKPADIMRQTLVLEKKPTAVLTNERATPEEIVVAMLAMNKIMQDLLKLFQKQLELNAEDKSWQEAIMEKSKRREKIERTEMKRRKRMETKEQKAMERKRTEWLAENRGESVKQEEEDPEEESDKTVKDEDGEPEAVKQNENGGEWKVEQISEVENADENENKSKTRPKNTTKTLNSKKTEKQITEKLPKKEKNFNKEKLKEVVEATNKNVPESQQKFSKQANVAKENLSKPANTTKKANPKKPKYVEPVQEVQKVVDPFFITDSGENYVATVAVLPPTEADQMEEDDEDGYGSYQKPMNRRQFRESERNNFHKQGAKRDFQSRSDFQRADNGFSNKRTTFNDSADHSTNEEEDVQNLHPSWAAKRKQKLIIASNMKRISSDFTPVANRKTFDDESEMHDTSNANATDMHPSWAAKQKLKPVIKPFEGKKIKFEEDSGKSEKTQRTYNEASETGLHPSWAAKQKLKPVIKAFEGKKIKFNENSTQSETTNTKATSAADLHPSWAAKQKLKPVIKAFEGTKIKFDDD